MVWKKKYWRTNQKVLRSKLTEILHQNYSKVSCHQKILNMPLPTTVKLEPLRAAIWTLNFSNLKKATLLHHSCFPYVSRHFLLPQGVKFLNMALPLNLAGLLRWLWTIVTDVFIDLPCRYDIGVLNTIPKWQVRILLGVLLQLRYCIKRACTGTWHTHTHTHITGYYYC